MQSNDTPHQPAITRPCEICGTPVTTRASRAAKGYGRFCGGTCYGLSKQNRAALTCALCGEPFTAKPSARRKFCSDRCGQLASARPAEERWLAMVEKGDLTWRWTGAVSSTGYGNFMVSKAPPTWMAAHQFAWFLATGYEPTTGEVILHACDEICRTPLCVRNDEPGIYIVGGKELPRMGHLVLGTYADNMIDAAEKGRLGKLTNAAVLDMRRLGDAGAPIPELALTFGVSHALVSQVLHRKQRRYI